MRTFVLCDSGSVNSYGFSINLEGMNLERFKQNPVMLYRHDSEDVIGRWENLRIEDGKLLAEADFDMEDETAKKVANKVQRGYLKGCSVGIIVDKMSETEEGGVSRCVAERTELLEASVCAIPADAGAVVLMDRNHKRLSNEEVKTWLCSLQAEKPVGSAFNNNSNTLKMEEKIKEMEALCAEKDARIAELEAKVAENKKNEVEMFLSNAVACGKISEGEKAGFAKLSEGDFDTVKELVSKREQKATMSLAEMGRKSLKAEGREGWSYMDWMKNDSEGLKRMKAENPAEFERLREELRVKS